MHASTTLPATLPATLPETAPAVMTDALYPSQGTDEVIALRQYGAASRSAPWPAFAAGARVELWDDQGWIWDATVMQDAPAGATRLSARVVGERRSQPFPKVVGGVITLSNMGGHAHSRSWRLGDVVRIGDDFWRIAKKPKVLDAAGTAITYALAPSTPEAHAARPGRMGSAGRRTAALAAVGSAIETPMGEWLHVTKVEGRGYGSAEGERFGTIYYVVGRYVSAAKAEVINDLHGPSLSAALGGGERVRGAVMPADATVLVPRDTTSLAATGERVAIVDGQVLHERCGDPDQNDAWYPYVVRISDPELVARVARFVAKAAKATKATKAAKAAKARGSSK